MEIGRIRMRCHRLDDRFPQPHCTTLSWHIHTTYFSFFLFFNDDGDDDLMRLWLVWCGVQLILKLKVMFRWSLVDPAPLPLLRRRRRSSSSSSFPPVAVISSHKSSPIRYYYDFCNYNDVDREGSVQSNHPDKTLHHRTHAFST